MTPRSHPLVGLPLLEDLPELDGRRVLVRVDFNVPLGHLHGEDAPAEVIDDFRIRAALPTIEWLRAQGAEVVLCSHIDRPVGPDPRFAVQPVRDRLEQLISGVDLMENLRFDPGEEDNDPAFVRRLVDGIDYYVNDAFGVSHRSHASVVGPPAMLPSAAGRLLAHEVKVIGDLLDAPARPFVAVVGGSKVSDKLGVLRALLSHVDVLAVGGGMAFTFLAARGESVGDSLVESSRLEECRRMLDEAGDRLLLPSDIVAIDKDRPFGPGRSGGVVEVVHGGVPDGWRGLDIGPDTAFAFTEAIDTAGTVLWNGPVGVFEDDRFSEGTRVVAEAVAACPGFSVVGGGDTVAAVSSFKLADRVGFVSTGGGAALELIEYGDLPGLAALRMARNAPGSSRHRAPK
jgi:phosphoglycerate kinase